MTPDIAEASLELQYDAHLGEGPVWDEIEQKLYWLDILSDKLFVYDPQKKKQVEYAAGDHPGCFALRKNGGLVMTTRSGFCFFDPGSGRITPVTDPESDKTGNRFNDGKCDPAGRFWAGTMAYEIRDGAGSLYCLNTDLSVDLKVPGVTISNGLAWNKYHNRFFFIDTPLRKIFVFDYDKASGSISNRRVVCEIGENQGYPDGMTIDTEDHLWVALYGGGKVLRINPENGLTVMEIHLPVPKVTSCAFGGQNLDELYITTCREHMTKEEVQKAPLSGSLFKVRLPFAGYPAFRFAG